MIVRNVLVRILDEIKAHISGDENRIRWMLDK